MNIARYPVLSSPEQLLAAAQAEWTRMPGSLAVCLLLVAPLGAQ